MNDDVARALAQQLINAPACRDRSCPLQRVREHLRSAVQDGDPADVIRAAVAGYPKNAMVSVSVHALNALLDRLHENPLR